MDYRRHTLHLSIPFDLCARTGIDSCLYGAEQNLERSGWEDGRYPFPREMVCEGLKGLIREAVFNAVRMFMEQKYGRNHMTPHATGETNTAYLKAQEWLREDFGGVGVEGDGWKVEIEARNEQ